MIDAVLSYHMNPQTCGVAKFNHALAKRLGVPCLPLDKHPVAHPLISIKRGEVNDYWSGTASWYHKYDLLLHDRPDLRGLHQDNVYSRANRLFYADELGCPSTIDGDPTRGAYRVLVFGMAHKLNLPHFERLKEQLDREHPDYTIELSTAVHEGNPWDEALTEGVRGMEAVFGKRLRVLGFLGDDALSRLLGEVDAVAAYYTPALRANHTTYWAAVEAGKTIYTNRDEHSPKEGAPPVTWDKLIEVLR